MNSLYSIERRAWGLAVVLHVVVLLFFIVRFTHSSPSLESADIIQAVAVPMPANTPSKSIPETLPPPPAPEPLQLKEGPQVEEQKRPEPVPTPTPAVKQPAPTPQPVAKPQPTVTAQPTASANAATHNPMAADIERYRLMIATAIGRYWLVPPNLNPKLTSILAVRVAPGGVVIDVQIAQSSGSAELDQSALQAVMKASPLPVPSGELFDQFRELRLTVRPEGIISQT